MSQRHPIDRFFECVAPPNENGCWMWTGPGEPYGHFFWGHCHELAHRFSFQICIGKIPEGLFVCHKCDVTLCVNPDHLFLGTALDNNRDCIAKGRQWYQKAKQESPAN